MSEKSTKRAKINQNEIVNNDVKEINELLVPKKKYFKEKYIHEMNFMECNGKEVKKSIIKQNCSNLKTLTNFGHTV